MRTPNDEEPCAESKCLVHSSFTKEPNEQRPHLNSFISGTWIDGKGLLLIIPVILNSPGLPKGIPEDRKWLLMTLLPIRSCCCCCTCCRGCCTCCCCFCAYSRSVFEISPSFRGTTRGGSWSSESGISVATALFCSSFWTSWWSVVEGLPGFQRLMTSGSILVPVREQYSVKDFVDL